MKNKKRVLFLLDNPFVNDKRVYLEAKTLVDVGYEVDLIAVRNEELPEKAEPDGIRVHRLLGHDIYDIKQSACFKRYARQLSGDFDFDIIHAHDQAMLHLGVQIKKLRPDVKLIYDSHELFHEWPINMGAESRWIRAKSLVVRKLMVMREKKNGRHIDRLITVNGALADILAPYFGTIKEAAVVHNFPQRRSLPDNSDYLRETFNIPAADKIILYFGKNIYLRSINIEQVLKEFRGKPDVTFVFIAEENERSEAVKRYVKDQGHEKVFFHGLIKPGQIQNVLSSADVGLLSTWNKKDKSYWLSLGNKLFDYIHAGLPVLTTAQPEYKKIIDAYRCGVAVNPDEAGAYDRGYDIILSDYDTYKQRCAEAAEELCWEKEEEKLIDLYNRL